MQLKAKNPQQFDSLNVSMENMHFDALILFKK